MASLRSVEGGFFLPFMKQFIGHDPENLTLVLSHEPS
jgi:hypothetical protein